MATDILNSGDTLNLGASPTVQDVFGTNGAETLILAMGSHVVLDASFNRGGDTINLAGPASAYTAVMSGSSIVLTDTSGGSVTIPVGTAGEVINFADASRTLVYNPLTHQFVLGTEVVTTTPEAVTPGTTPPATPTYDITPSATSINEGQSVTFILATTNVAAGTALGYTISGTNDAAGLAASGTVTLDSSGHASVTVALPTNATLNDSGALTLALLNGAAHSTVTTVDTSVNPATLPQTFTLTTGIDTFTSTALSHGNLFNSTDNNFTYSPTLTNLDALTGNASDTLNVSYTSNEINTLLIPGLSVNGIGTANLSTTVTNSYVGGFAITADTNGWSGLTILNAASGAVDNTYGAIDVSAAQTTNVTAISSSGDVFINGGKDVSVQAIAANVSVGAGAPLTPGDPITNAGNVGVLDTQVGSSDVTVVGGALTNAVYVTTTGGTGGNTVTIDPPTGLVIVNTTQDSGHQGHIDITGGSTVTVNETADNTSGFVYLGHVVVNGTGNTTSVTVNQSGPTSVGFNYGRVDINGNDNGALTSVTLNGLGGWNTIDGSSLNTLALSNIDSASISLNSDGSTNPSSHLDLTTGINTDVSTFDDDHGYTSMALHVAGGTYVDYMETPSLTSLTIDGASSLEIWTLDAASNVTIDASNDTGGVLIDHPLGSDQGFTGGSGSDNIGITYTGTDRAISMGDGNDTVRYHSGTILTGGSLDGGAGWDTLDMSTTPSGVANAAALSATMASVTGFEQLDISVTSGNNPFTVNLQNLGNINYVQSYGTEGTPGTPTVQVYDWVAPALTPGESITIDGVTVTAYAFASSDQVAHAVIAQLTNPTLPENVPGFLNVTIDTGAVNPLWTATQGTSANDVTFTYHDPAHGGDYGFQPQLPVTAFAAPALATAPTEAEIQVGQNPYTETATIDFGPTVSAPSDVTPTTSYSGAHNHTSWVLLGLAQGQQATIDGVTVLATGGGGLTAAQESAAFVSGANGAGYLLSGTVGTPGNWASGGTFSDITAGTLVLTETGFDLSHSYTGAAVGGGVSPEVLAGNGSSITIDGEIVTVLDWRGVTSQDLINAFVNHNTDGGKLGITGTLNVTQWTLGDNADGHSILATSTTGNTDVVDFAAGNVTVNGGAVMPTVNNAVENASATVVTPAGTPQEGAASHQEVDQVTFGALAIGQSVTVDGVTILATTALTATDVAAIAGQIANATNYSAPLVGYTLVANGSAVAEVTGTTSGNWSNGFGIGNQVSYTYLVDLTDGHSVPLSESNPTGTSGTGVFTPSGGVGTAPLILNGYTSGGTLELTAGASVNADITVNVTGALASPSDVFNIVLDGGVNGTAPVYLPNVETLDITSNGVTLNTVDIKDAALTTLNLSGGTDLTVNDAPGGHLTVIDASSYDGGTTGGVDNVIGVADLLSTTANLTFIGGGGLLMAEDVATTHAVTVTSGAGGVTFIADGTTAFNEGQLTFHLAASAGAVDTLHFQDASANYAFPALVDGFQNFAGLGPLSDHLVFDNGSTSVLGNVSSAAATVVNGVEYTAASGVLTFSGIGLGGASVSDLINAAEAIVNATPGATAEFQTGGNSYVVHAGVTPSGVNDTVIELVGLTGLTALSNDPSGWATHTMLIA